MDEKRIFGETVSRLLVASIFAAAAVLSTTAQAADTFIDTWTLSGRFVDKTTASTRVITGVTIPNFHTSVDCENAATQLKTQVLTEYGQGTTLYYTCVKVRGFAYSRNLF